jgi:glutaredoxin 3
MNTPEWTLYVKSGCPWCIEATAYLKRGGYAFQEVNVSADAAAYRRMKELSGQSYTPTLVFNDDLLLADFDTGQLEKFLSEHRLAK